MHIHMLTHISGMQFLCLGVAAISCTIHTIVMLISYNVYNIKIKEKYLRLNVLKLQSNFEEHNYCKYMNKYGTHHWHVPMTLFGMLLRCNTLCTLVPLPVAPHTILINLAYMYINKPYTTWCCLLKLVPIWLWSYFSDVAAVWENVSSFIEKQMSNQKVNN